MQRLSLCYKENMRELKRYKSLKKKAEDDRKYVREMRIKRKILWWLKKKAEDDRKYVRAMRMKRKRIASINRDIFHHREEAENSYEAADEEDHKYEKVSAEIECLKKKNSKI